MSDDSTPTRPETASWMEAEAAARRFSKEVEEQRAALDQAYKANLQQAAEIERLTAENERLRADLMYFDSAFDTVLDEVADLQHQMLFLMPANGE